MKIHLRANIIGVGDVKKASQWYADIFGMEIVELEPPYFCEMRLVSNYFLIEKHNPELPVGFQKIPTGVRISAIFEVDDMKMFIDDIKNKGVKVVHGPVMQSWGGLNAIIQDPYGNDLILNQDELE